MTAKLELHLDVYEGSLLDVDQLLIGENLEEHFLVHGHTFLVNRTDGTEKFEVVRISVFLGSAMSDHLEEEDHQFLLDPGQFSSDRFLPFGGSPF